MNAKLFAIGCACIIQSVEAIAADSPELTTRQVEIACLIKGGNEDAQDLKIHVCLTPITAFIDGYRRGAENGIRKTLPKNAGAIASTKSIDDRLQRYAALKPSAHCMPDSATTEQIVDVFTSFSSNHPDLFKENFTSVLADAIEEKFCSR